MKLVRPLFVLACLMLTSCGETPWDAREREQREDTLRWLEDQEMRRQSERPDK